MVDKNEKQEFMEQPLEGETTTQTDMPRDFDVEALHADQLSGSAAGRSSSSLNFPFPLVVLFLIAGFASGAYLMSGGAGDGPAGAEEAPEVELSLAEQGEKVYGRICQACHQPNGLGIAGQYPPLAESEWVTGGNKVPLLIVLHGLAGPIEVRGNNYNGNMAPWANQMSDQDISAVLTFVRQAWGNSASPISAEEVAAARELYGNDHPQWNPDELLEMGLETNVGGGETAAADDAAALADPASSEELQLAAAP